MKLLRDRRRARLSLLAGMYPHGGLASVGFDWQLMVGYALDATLRAGYVQTEAGPSAVILSQFGSGSGVSSGSFPIDGSLGVRFRCFPRLGFMLTSGGPSATADVQVGYEWSVARPMQLGVFVRPGIGYGAGFIAAKRAARRTGASSSAS